MNLNNCWDLRTILKNSWRKNNRDEKKQESLVDDMDTDTDEEVSSGTSTQTVVNIETLSKIQ